MRTAIVLAVALVGCKGKDAPMEASNKQAIELVSDDGALTLTFPPGALMDGVSEADLDVRPLSDGELTMEGGEILGAYELLPDGARFAVPVQLAWRLPLSNALVTFDHLATSTFEPLIPIDADVTDTQVTHELQVEHFSRVVAVRDEFATIEVVEEYSDPVVGQPTHTLLRVVVDPGLTSRVYRNAYSGTVFTSTWVTGQTWSAEYHGLTGRLSDDVLAPSQLKSVESTINLSLTWSPRPFTCVSANFERIASALFVVHEVRRDTVLSSGHATSGAYNQSSMASWGSGIDCLEATADETGQYIDSISSQAATFTSGAIDIASHWAESTAVTQDFADALKNNSTYECGDDGAESGFIVVCDDPSQQLDEGELLNATINLAAPAPTGDTEHAYIYSLVLDTDGDPANNWQFNPPYDWDLFRDSDRWYQLIWDHSTQAWDLTVTQVMANQSLVEVPSGAWAVIEDTHINFFVPGDEYDAALATYRVTAFGHDGSFSPSDRGADVSGEDPQSPLLPIR